MLQLHVEVYGLQSHLLHPKEPLRQVFPVIEVDDLSNLIRIRPINFLLIIGHIYGCWCNIVLNQGFDFLGFLYSVKIDWGGIIRHTVTGGAKMKTE